jgi:hypothetical protein
MKSVHSKRLGHTVLAAFAVLALASAARADDFARDFWWLDDPIEGSWNVTVTITPPPATPGGSCADGPVLTTFKAMALYGRGGTFHDINETAKSGPFPRTTGFGTWERVKWRHYRFAAKFFVLDFNGLPAGWTIVRHDVVLGRDGQAYASKGTAENFDANGAPLIGVPGRPPVGCSSSTAARFE